MKMRLIEDDDFFYLGRGSVVSGYGQGLKMTANKPKTNLGEGIIGDIYLGSLLADATIWDEAKESLDKCAKAEHPKCQYCDNRLLEQDRKCVHCGAPR